MKKNKRRVKNKWLFFGKKSTIAAMQERGVTYTALSRANTERIRISATFPFGIENEVGLDTAYVHKLLQIGGLKSIKILSDTSGDRSSTVIQPVGWGSDGTTLAGKGKVNMVPTYSNRLEGVESGNISKQNNWPSLDLVLNNAEITQRMLQSKERVVDPENWAREIDRAIRQAIRDVGTKHLLDISSLSDLDKIWMIVASVSVSLFAFQGYWLSFVTNELLRLISSSDGFRFIENFRSGEGYRLSLVPGLEFDRAIALQIYSRAKPAAKALVD